MSSPARPAVTDAVRRARLIHRHLLGPAGRTGRDPVAVVDALALVHATDPSCVYLGIHARSDAPVDDVAAALYRDRQLLRHTVNRRTVFVMHRDVAPLAHGAHNHRLLRTLRRNLATWLAADDVVAEPAAWLADLEDRTVVALRDIGRATGNELAAAVPDLRTTVDPARGKAFGRPIRLTSKVLEIIAADGRIGRGEPAGDLTANAWRWEPIDPWYPDGMPAVPPADALVGLLRRHLRTFGPVTEVDVVWWTGLPKGLVRAALATLEVVAVDLEGGGIGLVLPDDVPTDGDDVADVVALLPGLDTTPMGWKERDWFLGDHSAALFDRSGNIGPTVWVGGRIVGSWTQRRDGAVVTGLLETVDARAAAAIAAEAERIAAWLGEVRVNWRYPTPLQRSLER